MNVMWLDIKFNCQEKCLLINIYQTLKNKLVNVFFRQAH